jgi:hypothetical protein
LQAEKRLTVAAKTLASIGTQCPEYQSKIIKYYNGTNHATQKYLPFHLHIQAFITESLEGKSAGETLSILQIRPFSHYPIHWRSL